MYIIDMMCVYICVGMCVYIYIHIIDSHCSRILLFVNLPISLAITQKYGLMYAKDVKKYSLSGKENGISIRWASSC